MSPATTTQDLCKQDEINEIQCCLDAIVGLMIPCSDLKMVDRDSLATLLDYFLRRLRAVNEAAS